MKCYCIGDEDTVRGFRLAGIDGWVVTSPDAAREALRSIQERGDGGLLILTHTAAGWVRESLRVLRLQFDQPLVLEIPGPDGGTASPDELGTLVRSAVGLRLEPAPKT